MSSAVFSEASALKIRLKKLKALEKGEVTDFKFLVGQDDETAEVSFLTFYVLSVNFRGFLFIAVDSLLQE